MRRCLGRCGLMLLAWAILAQSCCLAELIENPKSASAMIGEVLSFNCSGIGTAVIWYVDGVQNTDDSLSEKGIGPSKSTTSSKTTFAQLSVTATAENNNISISCLVVNGVIGEISAVAVLTVLGVGVVMNVMVVEDNSTQLTLTWEEPFHSQDVIYLYYIVFVIDLDSMNEQVQNTTNTSVDWRISNCGQYQFIITAYGNHGGDSFPYEAVEVTVDHNATFSGVYQVSGLENSIEVEYQGLDFCNANLTILREPFNVCSRPEYITISSNCSNQSYALTVEESKIGYTVQFLSTHERCKLTLSSESESEDIIYFDTFRTRNISIIDFGQMENGDHSVSFTCYFAPCVGIKGKCFIDFMDGRRNITIEADHPADTSATYYYIGTLDDSVQLISVHDVFPNGTFQKEAAIHTSIPVSFPTSASHVLSVGSSGSGRIPGITTSLTMSPSSQLTCVAGRTSNGNCTALTVLLVPILLVVLTLLLAVPLLMLLVLRVKRWRTMKSETFYVDENQYELAPVKQSEDKYYQSPEEWGVPTSPTETVVAHDSFPALPVAVIQENETNYAEIARSSLQQPSKPSSKDLERVEYVQVVAECKAIPLVVVDLPKSTDMPQEEKIMRKHKKELENVLSDNFTQLLSKLNEKSILDNEQLNHLKRLPVRGKQVSLLADFLIEKASSEKEMCSVIINFLLQEVVSAKLGRIMAEELGMFGALEELADVPEDAHLVSSSQHCNSEIGIERQHCSLRPEHALTMDGNASHGKEYPRLQSKKANMEREFVLASEPFTYARSSSKGEENMEIAPLSESSSLGHGGVQNAVVVVPASCVHALPLGEQGNSHSTTLAPVRVLDEENVTQQIQVPSIRDNYCGGSCAEESSFSKQEMLTPKELPSSSIEGTEFCEDVGYDSQPHSDSSENERDGRFLAGLNFSGTHDACSTDIPQASHKEGCRKVLVESGASADCDGLKNPNFAMTTDYYKHRMSVAHEEEGYLPQSTKAVYPLPTGAYIRCKEQMVIARPSMQARDSCAIRCSLLDSIAVAHPVRYVVPCQITHTTVQSSFAGSTDVKNDASFAVDSSSSDHEREDFGALTEGKGDANIAVCSSSSSTTTTTNKDDTSTCMSSSPCDSPCIRSADISPCDPSFGNASVCLPNSMGFMPLANLPVKECQQSLEGGGALQSTPPDPRLPLALHGSDSVSNSRSTYASGSSLPKACSELVSTKREVLSQLLKCRNFLFLRCSKIAKLFAGLKVWNLHAFRTLWCNLCAKSSASHKSVVCGSKKADVSKLCSSFVDEASQLLDSIPSFSSFNFFRCIFSFFLKAACFIIKADRACFDEHVDLTTLKMIHSLLLFGRNAGLTMYNQVIKCFIVGAKSLSFLKFCLVLLKLFSPFFLKTILLWFKILSLAFSDCLNLGCQSRSCVDHRRISSEFLTVSDAHRLYQVMLSILVANSFLSSSSAIAFYVLLDAHHPHQMEFVASDTKRFVSISSSAVFLMLSNASQPRQVQLVVSDVTKCSVSSCTRRTFLMLSSTSQPQKISLVNSGTSVISSSLTPSKGKRLLGVSKCASRCNFCCDVKAKVVDRPHLCLIFLFMISLIVSSLVMLFRMSLLSKEVASKSSNLKYCLYNMICWKSFPTLSYKHGRNKWNLWQDKCCFVCSNFKRKAISLAPIGAFLGLSQPLHSNFNPNCTSQYFFITVFDPGGMDYMCVLQIRLTEPLHCHFNHSCIPQYCFTPPVFDPGGMDYILYLGLSEPLNDNLHLSCTSQYCCFSIVFDPGEIGVQYLSAPLNDDLHLCCTSQYCCSLIVFDPGGMGYVLYLGLLEHIHVCLNIRCILQYWFSPTFLLDPGGLGYVPYLRLSKSLHNSLNHSSLHSGASLQLSLTQKKWILHVVHVYVG